MTTFFWQKDGEGCKVVGQSPRWKNIKSHVFSLAKCYFPPKDTVSGSYFGLLLENLECCSKNFFKTLITLEPDVLFISDASRNYWLKNFCIRPLSDFLKSVSLAVIMTTITFWWPSNFIMIVIWLFIVPYDDRHFVNVILKIFCSSHLRFGSH